jgi:hypothetical protein
MADDLVIEVKQALAQLSHFLACNGVFASQVDANPEMIPLVE